MRLFLFGAGWVAVEGNSREAVISGDRESGFLSRGRKRKRISERFLEKPTQQKNGPLRPLKSESEIFSFDPAAATLLSFPLSWVQPHRSQVCPLQTSPRQRHAPVVPDRPLQQGLLFVFRLHSSCSRPHPTRLHDYPYPLSLPFVSALRPHSTRRPHDYTYPYRLSLPP